MEKTKPARSFQDLKVWQQAHALVLDIYLVTQAFPKEEMYALTNQLRRAAVSIPANIVEGFRRIGVADKQRFLNIAQGSLEETRYFLILSRDLGYHNEVNLESRIDQVGRMLNGYRSAIGRNSSAPQQT